MKWWKWFERENIPVIYCTLRDTPHATYKEFKDLCGTNVRHIFYWEKNNLKVYWNQTDLNVFTKNLFKNIHQGFIEKIAHEHKINSKKLIDFCENFEDINFSVLENKSILKYLENFEKLYSNLAIYTYIPVFAAFPLEDKLIPYLKSKTRSNFAECWQTLTQPEQRTWTAIHEEELLRISLIPDPNEQEKQLKAHIKKYRWLMLGYQFMEKPLDEKFFRKKLNKLKKNKFHVKSKSINYKKDLKTKKQQIITEYKIDKTHEILINSLSTLIGLKEFRDGIYTRSHFEFEFLLKEILSRNNIDFETGALLTIKEYKKLLKGEQIDLNDIKNRKNAFLWIFDPDEQYYTGIETTKKLNLEISENKIINTTNVIKGTIASRGYAKGIVRVIHNESEIEKVLEGDMLVTYMTKPSFLPAMKKASAFITDEGGITCHAAIVSRELKKPCIIGTKIATKVLKDGDLIEVNANEGIIKILK